MWKVLVAEEEEVGLFKKKKKEVIWRRVSMISSPGNADIRPN